MRKDPKKGARSRRAQRLRKALLRPLPVACIAFLAIVVVACVGAPWFAPFDPVRLDFQHVEKPPSARNWFGTDDVGRDIFSRVLWGGRVSLIMGLLGAGIATCLGVLLGILSGFYQGTIGGFILRVMDFLLAFPGILLALAIVAVLGPSVLNVIIAVGIGATPSFVRVVYSSVLTVRQQEYVEAAKANGLRDAGILVRHVFPNIVPVVIVLFTVQIANSIFVGSSLSFLGLGAQPPSPEWGAMVSRGRYSLQNAIWMSAFPGAVIAMVCVSINLLGDSLRDALDPRTSV